MEPLINERQKRCIAAFIPYRVVSSGYEFFLQKRDMAAVRSPGLLGLFGGGVEEGEDFEEGFRREIKEELTYEPSNPEYFCRYENARGVIHIFIEEVAPDFESQIAVLEGEYGKFFATPDVTYSREASHLVRTVIPQLDEFLTKR
jgi:8-oxo-dGTP pyrophosphatase MutT (NUDIX family)